MSFESEIKRHLSFYKKQKFPSHPNGFWNRSNPPKELFYAFSPEEGDYNLLPDYKDKFLAYEKALKNKIKRHMYFHHMNSSQAMCINFFFPLLFENKLEHITKYLGFQNEKINYKSVSFEKISKIESSSGHRPTNFDFYFETASGKQFFFEIKYTEYQFGKAAMDQDHINKYETVYSKHLAAIRQNFHGSLQFLTNYQLLRNLIHVGTNAYVVFVYPRENVRINREAEMAKNEMITDEFKSNVLNIEWENIVDFVNSKVQEENLKKQFVEFRKKYFMEARSLKN